VARIIVFNLLSLDGFFEGKNHDISWHRVDDEFNKFAVQHTKQFGSIIFGSRTYKLFEDFWPTAVNNPEMSNDDQEIAKIIDDAKKFVFSKKLKKFTWKNSILLNDINKKEIEDLKKKNKKDMVIFGSGTIVSQFSDLGLIDEYRFIINPVVLGEGTPMFNDVAKGFNLKLKSNKVFKNGNILVSYSE